MIKLIFYIVTLIAVASCQGPPNGIVWADEPHPQQPMPQHIHHVEAHARAAQGEEEETLGSPMLGTPLIGLKMAMAKPFMFGIPGMRFSNFKMGHLGPIKYGNVLLGAENPYAAEAELGAPQQYNYQQAEPQVGAHHHHHHHIQEAQLGSPQQYQGAHYHYQQAEAQLGAPQPFQGAEHHYHQANLGAPQQYDSYNLGAPGDEPQPMRPLGPIANLFQPIVQPGSLFQTPNAPKAPEQRTWGKG